MGLIEKRPRLVVAQAAQANPLFKAYQKGLGALEPVQAGKTEASAIQIGNPVSYARAVRTLKAYAGEVYQVTEAELADAAHRADRTGLYCDPHTGVALGALEQMAAAGRLHPDEKVVVISTAHGLKFSEFKTRYHERKLPDSTGRYANDIIRCRPDLGVVKDALNKRLATA
jgi:threonine synthase